MQPSAFSCAEKSVHTLAPNKVRHSGTVPSVSPKKKRTESGRKPATGRGLLREVAYLHTDEAEALRKEAERLRCSKSEVIRRLIRRHFGIED